MNKKRYLKFIIVPLAVVGCVLFVLLANYLIQRFWAHRNGYFTPSYEKVELTEESDYETIFLQTGLGKSAVDKLLEEDNFDAILKAQEDFFAPVDRECQGLLGWFTREDRLVDAEGTDLVDLQPGDIILTLSTHSLGWRHGHAALIINPYTTLESAVLGQNSIKGSINWWTDYTNYVVLRIKDVTPEQQQEVVAYALENLYDVPYHLSSGFIGPKAPDPEDPQFGLHCSYLVWYAWNHFGYDTDSDGGRLVSCYDLLHSDEFEIVQMYGMDPREFQ